MIGIGALVLSRARIGRECLIAAGAVITPDMSVPDRTVVMGVPGRVVRPVTEKDIEYMRWLAPHYFALAERSLT